MAIAYDASSDSGEFAVAGEKTWTHTPVGTPRGVILLWGKRGSGNQTVSHVRYGGVDMTAIDNVSNADRVRTYWLGTGVPTGAQTVSISGSFGGVSNRVTVLTVTASGDAALEDHNALSGSGTNPSIALTAVARDSVVAAALVTAETVAAALAPGTGYTQILEATLSGGVTPIFSTERRTSNASASVTAAWADTASRSYVAAAVALREVGQQIIGGVATETDSAVGGTVDHGSTMGSPGLETDTAVTGTVTKIIAGSVATETDTSVSGSISKAGDLVGYTPGSLVLTPFEDNVL